MQLGLLHINSYRSWNLNLDVCLFHTSVIIVVLSVFTVVLLDTAASESLNWVTYSSGDEDVVGRRGVRQRLHRYLTFRVVHGFLTGPNPTQFITRREPYDVTIMSFSVQYFVFTFSTTSLLMCTINVSFFSTKNNLSTTVVCRPLIIVNVNIVFYQSFPSHPILWVDPTDSENSVCSIILVAADGTDKDDDVW